MRYKIALLALVLSTLACYTQAPINPTPTAAATGTVPAKKQGGTATLTPTPACAVVVALKSLNLRVSASENAPADPLGLQRGDELTILHRESAWFYVEVADGRRGYVRAAYVVECK